MVNNKSYKFKGSGDKLITADLSWHTYKQGVPICVYVHGFKGFKDWGAWPLAAQIFAVRGIPFFKFNFSHNGTSPEQPTEFVDLDAFSKNTISKELEELGKVFDFIENKAASFDFDWNGDLFVLGHSLGGTVGMLRTLDDERIKKCASWAGVSDLNRYLTLGDEDEWLRKGYITVQNSRTGQELPVAYTFYLDISQNRGKFDLLERLEELKQDLLIVQGDVDTTVLPEEAEAIYDAVLHSIKVNIPKADHTFNVKHPLTEKKIPLAFAQAVDETIEFFQM